MIIKSLGCHPEVKLSNFANPDGIPDKPSLLAISSIFFFASITRSCALIVDFFIFP